VSERGLSDDFRYVPRNSALCLLKGHRTFNEPWPTRAW
jgi:hypothetical protein